MDPCVALRPPTGVTGGDLDMTSQDDFFPDDRTLSNALRGLLAARKSDTPLSNVLERLSNPLSSTFDSEIVKCLLVDGRTLKLLCKYAPAEMWNTWGHRRGVCYEADVYGRVLKPLGVSTPRCYGLHVDARTGSKMLVLEYVESAEYLDAPQLQLAGAWLGAFHRCAKRFSAKAGSSFLIRYDSDYYASWALRTRDYCRQFLTGQDAEWLERLCDRFVQNGSARLLSSATIIHGEFYKSNVLVSGDKVHVVDWESCAVAAGEIDLAMLIEGWPADVAKETKK